MPTLDTNSETGLLKSSGTPYSYLNDLKSKLTPAQYNALIAPLMYTANEVYGGKVQDYQAQLLMPIDTAKAGIPKQIEVTKPETLDKLDVYYGASEDSPSYVDRYRSKEPVSINGVPVYANYDASGKLTGYEGDNRTTSWVNGKQRIIGNWDANGMPNPQTSTSSGAGIRGFVNDALSDPVLSAAANAAASYFGGPLGTAALGAVQGKSIEDIAKNVALSYAANQAFSTNPNAVGGVTGPDNIDVGGGFNPAAGAPPTIDTVASDFYGVPAGSEYVAPQVTNLGTVAGTTEGMLATPEGVNAAQGLKATNTTNLADLGGGRGILPGATTNLADMGAAQGLTTAGAAGGVLGATGLNAATGATAAGIGAGLGSSPAATGTGSVLTGVAAGAPLVAGAGTMTGTALGDMAAINAGAGVVGGLISSNAAKEAAEVQAAAADRAIAAQQKNFDTINAQQAAYRATGYNALNDIAALTTGKTPQYDANGNVVKDANGNPVMTTGSGYLQHQFDANDLKSGLAPNYDFMLGQGQMANQRAANMGGGALGGNALQGLNRYTQDYAGNAYQTAFNNYQTQRGNIYNTLAGIAGIGQTGQAATNTASTNATNAITQLGVGAAGANAAGTVGSANAYTNAINNAANNYTLASLLNQRGNVAMPV